MTAINAILTRAFDLLFSPFSAWPWLGMVMISFVSGLVLLYIFRYTSNQRGIQRAKDRIMSHLLEVLFYRDELGVVMRAQLRLLLDNLRYLGYALVPLVFMLLPMAVFLVQTDLHYGYRPLQPGESALVEVRLSPEFSNLDEVSLSASPGLQVETASLRMPAANEVDWKIKALAAGKQQLRVSIAGQEFSKEMVVAEGGQALSSQRVRVSLWQQFLNPGEPPFSADSPILWIKVSYPKAFLSLWHWQFFWIWPWLVLSMLFGLLLKGPLRVQV